MHRRTASLALVVATLALAACGGGEESASPLTVYAASSMKSVLPPLHDAARFQFAGSDTLGAQIEAGAPADVLVAAAPTEPEALRRRGLCGDGTPIASNALALIVPRTQPLVASLSDLAEGGHPLAVAGADVPVGAYAREALAALGLSGLLDRNPVSEEMDAGAIVAKVALGGAHAGIAYVTDAAASDDVRAIPLPAESQPEITYVACPVLHDGAPTEGAEAFIDMLASERGQEALRAAGFGPAS